MLHERTNITAPFAEYLKFQDRNDFCRSVLKKKKENEKYEDTIHFKTAKCRVLHERSNITAPFLEYLKF